MKLFDLMNYDSKNLFEKPELDPQNPIDRELAKTADDVKKDGSLDQDDIDAQQDPMIDPENIPDEPMGGNGPSSEPTDQEGPEEPTTPVDSELMGKVQNHDYISNYDHQDGTTSHPNTIMSLDMSELSQLRNKIRIEVDRTGIEDKIGSYANPKIKAAQDMLSFVDSVMGFKKKSVKQSPIQKSAKAKFKQRSDSNIKSGKRFKAKKTK